MVEVARRPRDQIIRLQRAAPKRYSAQKGPMPSTEIPDYDFLAPPRIVVRLGALARSGADRRGPGEPRVDRVGLAIAGIGRRGGRTARRVARARRRTAFAGHRHGRADRGRGRCRGGAIANAGCSRRRPGVGDRRRFGDRSGQGAGGPGHQYRGHECSRLLGRRRPRAEADRRGRCRSWPCRRRPAPAARPRRTP